MRSHVSEPLVYISIDMRQGRIPIYFASDGRAFSKCDATDRYVHVMYILYRNKHKKDGYHITLKEGKHRKKKNTEKMITHKDV